MANPRTPIATIAAAVQQSVLDLPLIHQLEIVRAIAESHGGWSYGADELRKGADVMEADYREDEAAAHKWWPAKMGEML